MSNLHGSDISESDSSVLSSFHTAGPRVRLPATKAHNKWRTSELGIPLMRARQETRSTTFLLKREQQTTVQVAKREVVSDTPDENEPKDRREESESILKPLPEDEEAKLPEIEKKEQMTPAVDPVFLLAGVPQAEKRPDEVPGPAAMSDEELMALKEDEVSTETKEKTEKVEPSLEIEGDVVEFVQQGKRGRLLVKNKDELEVWEARKGKKWAKVASTKAPMVGKGAVIFTLDDGCLGVIGANGPSDVVVLDTKNQWMAAHVIGAGEKRVQYAKAVSVKNGRLGWLVYCVGGLIDGHPADTIRVMSIKGDYCSFSDYLPSGALPPPRTDHTITKVGSRLLMTGGVCNGKLTADLWELDITQNPLRPKWVERQYDPIVPARSQHFAYEKHGVLFVCGGYDKDKQRLDDIWKWKQDKGWSKVGIMTHPELVLGAFSKGMVLRSQTFKPSRPGTIAESYQSKVNALLERRREYILRMRKNRKAVNEINQLKQQATADLQAIQAQKAAAGTRNTGPLAEQLKSFLEYVSECTDKLQQAGQGQLPERKKYTKELSAILQRKRERVKARLNRELMDKKTEAQLYSSVKANLEEKHGPLGKSIISLQTTDFASFSQFVQHLEQRSQNIATAYFYCFQLHHYERNIRRIKEIQKSVDGVIAKCSKTSHTISQMMRELRSIQDRNSNAQRVLKAWEEETADLQEESTKIDQMAQIVAKGSAGDLTKGAEASLQDNISMFRDEIQKIVDMQAAIKMLGDAAQSIRQELRKPKRDSDAFQRLQMKLKEAAKEVLGGDKSSDACE